MPDMKRTSIKNYGFSFETNKQVKGVTCESDRSEGEKNKKRYEILKGKCHRKRKSLEVCGKAKCQKKIDENHTCLQCEACKKLFHSKCVRINKLSSYLLEKLTKYHDSATNVGVNKQDCCFC